MSKRRWRREMIGQGKCGKFNTGRDQRNQKEKEGEDEKKKKEE